MDDPGSDEADDAPQASNDAGERASGAAGEQSPDADSASTDAPDSEVERRPGPHQPSASTDNQQPSADPQHLLSASPPPDPPATAHPQSAKAARRASDDDESSPRTSDDDATERQSSDDEAALEAEVDQTAAYVEQEASGRVMPNRGTGEEVGPTAVVGRSLEINETPSVRRRRRWVPPMGPPEHFNRYVVPRSPRRRRRDWPALMIALVVSAIVFVGCCIAGFAIYTTAGTP